MLLSAPTQAAAEYVSLVGRSAGQSIQALAYNAQRFIQDRPLWVAAGVVGLILLIWLTRPRRR